MDELILSGELLEAQEDFPFIVATVSRVNQDGVQISINAGMEPLKKSYRHVETGYALSQGDRVLVVKVSGTYVILGKITI